MYLYLSTCYSTCPNATFPSSTVCLPCPADCPLCQNTTYCTSCVSNLYLYLGTINVTQESAIQFAPTALMPQDQSVPPVLLPVQPARVHQNVKPVQLATPSRIVNASKSAVWDCPTIKSATPVDCIAPSAPTRQASALSAKPAIYSTTILAFRPAPPLNSPSTASPAPPAQIPMSTAPFATPLNA